MKKLLSIILSITMLLTMSIAVFADGVDAPMQPAKIKVGINAQFPPFEYYNENGELYGFDISKPAANAREAYELYRRKDRF